MTGQKPQPVRGFGFRVELPSPEHREHYDQMAEGIKEPYVPNCRGKIGGRLPKAPKPKPLDPSQNQDYNK